MKLMCGKLEINKVSVFVHFQLADGNMFHMSSHTRGVENVGPKSFSKVPN